MHLAINAYFWNRPNTGSGQYTHQLVYHLNRLVADLQITLVYPQIVGDPGPTGVPPGVAIRVVPLRRGHLGKVIFEQFTFPRACQAIGATIAHVPYWGSPLQSSMPLIVTVHDLTTVLVREYRRGFRPRMYNALISASAREADHIITDSLASKKDIIERLSIKPDKISAIHLAAGPAFKPEVDLLIDMAIRKKYELPDFYILYLGGYEIHKNVTTLLLAYTYAAKALGEEYPLVLAGKKPAGPSAHFPDYANLIRQLGIEELVHWIGFVEEEDKPAVYRGASCFAFPSRQEGFGLPPLEAMACGVPVVASNSASIPEVVGDAAFTIDPDDEKKFGGSLIATIVQEELAEEMKQKGVVQAGIFSWEKTATETLLIYDQLRGSIE